MTTDLPARRPAAPALPEGGRRTLGPADESRLALALNAQILSEEALELMPIDPDAAPGALLTAALGVRDLAEKVVPSAVVAEHARGTTWEQIGAAADITKQTAHERWAAHVRFWAATGRITLGDTSDRRSLDLAARLDADYALLHPEWPDAVSSGLEAVRHPGSADAAARQHAAFLHTRIQTLLDQSLACHGVLKERQEAGIHGAQIATVLREEAALDERQAALYDELAELEPELTAAHRASAQKRRTEAASSREFANRHEARAEPAPGADGEIL